MRGKNLIKMSIENKIKKMSKLYADQWMRLSCAKFLELVSFDENYINKVLDTDKKKKQICIANLLKEIRMLKLNKK